MYVPQTKIYYQPIQNWIRIKYVKKATCCAYFYMQGGCGKGWVWGKESIAHAYEWITTNKYTIVW